ncbi:hypothetical protein KSS87_022672 [Heliosperma pusillum]|nr:hypothetical protein KSS87_022672 [Heliosperma pusillum]
MEGVIKGSSPLRKLSSNSPSPSHSNSSQKKLREEEERLGLLFNKSDPTSSSSTSPPRKTPVIWRDSSYDFRNDPVLVESDSDGGEDDDVSTEFDFQKHNDQTVINITEPDFETQYLSPVTESPNEYGKITPRAAAAAMNKVSYKESEMFQRPSNAAATPRQSGISGGEDQVLRCSSNASFQNASKSGLMRMKTKSRLIDPHPDEKRSGRVDNRSGMIGRSAELEEDDPFDDDLPEDYKKAKFSFFTLVQWVSLVLIVAALVCNLVIKKIKKITVWGMQLWKWEVMVLVLICGGLVSGWLIKIIVFFIERNFLLRKRVLYFVYGLRSSVQKFLWLGWVLLAWVLILDKRVEMETKSQVLAYVTKILICFMVATFVWLIKTLLLKVLAMNFHVSAFFDRIQDALFNQYVIETLTGPPYIELRQIQEDDDRTMCEVNKLEKAGVHVPADLRANCLPNEGRVFGSGRSSASGLPKSPLVGKSPRSSLFGKSPRFAKSPSHKKDEEGDNTGINIDHLHRLNQKNISAWNMKRLMNIVRKGVVSTLDEQLDSGVEDDNAVQIRSEKEAKAAAKRVFTNVAKERSKEICVEDLMRFLREDEANRTMQLFEGAGDGKGISKRALKNWVVNVFRERRALALSLNDTKTAVNKLHHLVNILVGIVVIIIWLLILGVPVTHFLVFVSSQVVVLAFMFGNTCKTTFEAIIFLFVMHPFDVGDRCEIEGVQMVVEEMNILTTVFLRFDNQKIIYPNSVLATKPIGNYYRSPDMGDAIDFCVHISTPVEKLSKMKESITSYIEKKKEHWYTGPMIVLRDVEDMNRIKFSIWLSHTINHQDMGERWARRALLVEEMVKIFRELDIEYRMLPMDINVRNMTPSVSDRLPSNWSACSR